MNTNVRIETFWMLIKNNIYTVYQSGRFENLSFRPSYSVNFFRSNEFLGRLRSKMAENSNFHHTRITTRLVGHVNMISNQHRESFKSFISVALSFFLYYYYVKRFEVQSYELYYKVNQTVPSPFYRMQQFCFFKYQRFVHNDLQPIFGTV